MSVTIKKFYAGWCEPCKGLSPVVAAIAAELNLEVEDVNIETRRQDAIDYVIRGIPTLVVVDGTQEIGRIHGSHSYQQLKEKLEEIVNVS